MKLTQAVLLLLGVAMISAQTCYINNCGCPSDFKEDWCNDSQSQLESDWCNESEQNCGQCEGTWCNEQVRTEGICYIDVCGCPDNWLNSWCDVEEAKFESEWCQENNLRCDQCGGYWCEGEQLVEQEYDGEDSEEVVEDQDQDDEQNVDQDQDDELVEDNDQEEDQDQGEEQEQEVGTCYIDVCGCPNSFFNDWCEVESAKFGSEWCQRNSENCIECQGYWCVGDDLEEDTDEVEKLCYISECGCPGNFQQDWCETTYNFLPAGHCQENESNCQNCSGVWCTVDSDELEDIELDGEGDDITVSAQLNVYFAGLTLLLFVLNL